MQTINVFQLKSLIESGEPYQIVDIREYHEVESGHIGGYHIPMADILDRSDEIRRDIPVIIHCKSGKRGEAVVCSLERVKGFDNLMNLEGGIEAWANTFHPELVVY